VYVEYNGLQYNVTNSSCNSLFVTKLACLARCRPSSV